MKMRLTSATLCLAVVATTMCWPIVRWAVRIGPPRRKISSLPRSKGREGV